MTVTITDIWAPPSLQPITGFAVRIGCHDCDNGEGLIRTSEKNDPDEDITINVNYPGEPSIATVSSVGDSGVLATDATYEFTI